MTFKLTDPQKRVHTFVIKYWQDNGYPPTVSDVQREFGYSSYTGAETHILALERKGYVEKTPRGIFPTGLRGCITAAIETVTE